MAESDPRWLLLIHQIPPRPNYLRVKIGRRLQRLGAAPIKNSVYVLPRNDQAYEDFGWITREISQSGGEASVCEARFVDGLSDDQIEGFFNQAREADYAAISEEVRRVHSSLERRKKPDEEFRSQLEATVARLRKRLSDIVALDFFGANGSQNAEALFAALERRIRASAAGEAPTVEPRPTPRISGGLWVTRKGIHVDRMASAWLVQRFIDPQAKFKFVSGRDHRPEPGEIRFDMFDAEFTHEGDRCTFEVLVRRFELEDRALEPIAEIVHDIDLKDAKFGRPEVLGLDRVIAGICMVTKEDESRLAQGRGLLDGLYEYFRKKRA